MKKLIIPAALASISIAFAGGNVLSSPAQKKPFISTNKFDFYILSTQWIPGWCVVDTGQSEANLDSSRACQQQINNPLMYHGLWPENNDGSYPISCSQVPALDISRLKFSNPFNNYLNNSESFLHHEWEKHGTCSNYYSAGLESQNSFEYYQQVNHYFSRSIKLYQQIKLPTLPLQLSVKALSQQIQALNPQISQNSILAICDKEDNSNQEYLTGLWFCTDKAVQHYIPCPALLYKMTCHNQILTR